MSLVSSSQIINDYIKNILEKYTLNEDSIKSSAEYDELIKIIFNISFECFTKKKMLRKIENNQPEHFEIAKSTIFQDLENDIWIFGYGSLIWKVDFPYETCHRGYICGYARRFYQNSLDHRGIPEKPGRVVTCIPSTNDARVYGMAYKIPFNLKDEVLNHLDYREKNGYERCTLNFFHYPDSNKENFKVVMYIATADNESYAGYISNIKDIAEQIYWAWGPSGSNREYVYNLSAAMKTLFPDVNDTHLFELEIELKKKESLDDEIAKQIEVRLTNELYKIFKNCTNDNMIISEIGDLIENTKTELYHI